MSDITPYFDSFDIRVMKEKFAAERDRTITKFAKLNSMSVARFKREGTWNVRESVEEVSSQWHDKFLILSDEALKLKDMKLVQELREVNKQVLELIEEVSEEFTK